MKITTALLVAAGISPTQARVFADPLSAACTLFEINTPERVAAFLSQCAHESAHFTRLEENLFYSTPERILAMFTSRVKTIDQARSVAKNPKAMGALVYSSRLGNGDVASGDGWTFRGRGLIQLTGRANYVDASISIGRPYLAQPDLVAQPSDASLTAAWFWHSHKLNYLADVVDIKAITRVINGPALAGLTHRQELYKSAIQACFEAA